MNWKRAKTGLKYDPEIEWRFRPGFFIETRSEWEARIQSAIDSGDRLYDEAYPDAGRGGNVGPIGSVILYFSGPYVFAYEVDAYGSWGRVAYTHRVIAGEMEQFRDRCCFRGEP